MRTLKFYNKTDAEQALQKIDCSNQDIQRLAPKYTNHFIKLDSIPYKISVIILKEILFVGGDVALSNNNLAEKDTIDLIVIGTLPQLKSGCDRLNKYDELKDLVKRLNTLLSTLENQKRYEFPFLSGVKTKDNRTLVMGVLNVTPDSFSDGNQFFDVEDAVARFHEMAKNGADIIDIGGESSRPGAEAVSIEEELSRIMPVIEAIPEDLDIPISVDTYKSEVAKKVLDKGVSIINDISGLSFDPDLGHVVADYDASIVLMHTLDKPKTMQKNIKYEDLITDIYNSLEQSITKAVDAGIPEQNIIIDPGIGFGKTVGHNLEIIKRLEEFRGLDKPILIGTSRKSFIGKTLNLPVDDRLEGSLATIAVAVMNGANIVRVHDVMESRRVVDMTESIIYH